MNTHTQTYTNQGYDVITLFIDGARGKNVTYANFVNRIVFRNEKSYLDNLHNRPTQFQRPSTHAYEQHEVENKTRLLINGNADVAV
jgi:uncharacterized lipoprotein YddW (UPF0748 family)